MSSLEDSIIEQESRDYWWQFGEAVMREMTEDEGDEGENENKKAA